MRPSTLPSFLLVGAIAVVGLAPSSVASVVGQPTLAADTVAVLDPPTFPAGTTRLSGSDRYETSVAVSSRHQAGVPAVFVATGIDFPDALSAASGGAEVGGPVLLTRPTRLPDSVRAEVQRLAPQQIFVVGGSAVVSDGVRAELSRIAPTTRLAGVDRYATGRAIVERVFTLSDHAILADGRNFPDALSATGAAGSLGAPVILVDGLRSRLDAQTLGLLGRLGVRTVSIAGGPGAVSTGIEGQLGGTGLDVTRYGGATRFETSALINQAFFPAGSAPASFLATGLDFPDALSGGALAGHLAAPIAVSRRSCIDPVVADAIDIVSAPSRVVLGGPAVVTGSAAVGARCIHPVTNETLEGWSTSEWRLRRDVPAPYSDRPPVNVHDGTIALDATGLRIYINRATGQRADHPVAYAQYGISALLEYERTGDQIWLNRAVRHGERLTEIRMERDGAWWYPYRFAWVYYTRALSEPWWSAMAQGESLSLFVRLAEATGDAEWDVAAERTWRSFSQPYSATRPWSSLVIDNHLYFEEYAGDQLPLLVMNGHIFASFGLYDYWRRTDDPEVARYFNGGATSVLNRMMPVVRVEGGVSHYCVQAEYCHSSLWQNQPYHAIHIWQLETLARITADVRFTEWANTLRSDWSAPSLRMQAQETGPRAGTGGELDWIEP